MRRRNISTFSLSFLDIMSCGLGAAVLLFLIIKHHTDDVIEVSQDLTSETNLLQTEITAGQKDLAQIRNTLSKVDDRLAVAQGLARQISDELEALLAKLDELGPSEKEDLERIEQQIAILEQQKQTLEEESSGGNRVREFLGEGDRQYLTGLRLGGNRSLILLDASSSMLDETIVNIIRRRNRPDDIKRQSPKWQQAVSIVDWITSNLPPGTDMQVYVFNEKAEPLLQGSPDWIDNNDTDRLEKLTEALDTLIPEKGTNLLNAIEVITQLSPQPDNVFLITDGLPTQGKRASNGRNVSGAERLRYFNDAFGAIANEIPINTLLLPMEGDPLAASAYWRIALQTKGSFLAPARDWP